MNKMQLTNTVAMTIGIIAIGFGLYATIIGSTFQEYFFSLFIGICLFGTAFLNYREWKKNKGE